MLSRTDRNQLAEIHKVALLTPCDERSFLKLEGIFFDVISFARLHSGEVEESQLLYNLQQIQKNEFQLTQGKYSKAKQRELIIKKFKRAFTREMSSYLSR